MIKFNSVSKFYEINKKRSRDIKDILSFARKDFTQTERLCAIDNVSFEIYSGKSVGVLGRNGAGKSTLLKILTRVISPDRGKVEVNGSISCLLEVGTGFHHELSGFENIFLSGSILGMSRKEIGTHIESIIGFSGVEKFIDEPVKHYSSGMYMRLAFSIGIHLDSDILVIDETLTVGDIQFQQKCLDKIREIIKQGKTVFFVSHSLEQIREVCDTCLVMERGKLIFHGETGEATTLYNKLINGE
ncbi:ABC transporter ATP-binding protein [Xenorhabdus sp. KJ12.1]|uniref:ABC transporter ATP-binding protein n=1 Tax=Xenorhabdus sp. KJ12.1 TaxID=1851571 RepID=UPI000C042BF8|nr:ABC transporter ATP-binding protein [Xenorhabdus sp. KJ12.1]PHM66417.1 ABC transporter [Xenorhabdus sp. KJ12.1]